MKKGKFYITTSIAYTNAKPHIGYAMEVIEADVLARYHRLKGDDTFYATGTDEHGTKIMQTATEQGKTPQQFVDEISGHFHMLTKILNISNDYFIRTTDADHIAASQKIWQKMVDKGDIYKHSYEGLYCVGCESFKTEKDLVDGKCPNHMKAPEKVMEENYFFKLSKYNDQIKALISADKLNIVPEGKKNEILSVIEEGLKDVSFSRPKKVLQWGIPVPGDPDQVMYVWCDALTNYLTAVGYGGDSAAAKKQFEKFWPADVHLIGKDILRFHSAIWIGMLLSAELPVPPAIYVHGFITSEGKKMSKSLNNVVDPFEICAKYGTDAVRYYVLKEIPTTEDGDFSAARFTTVYGSELANTLGNLVNRVFAMTQKYFEGKVPSPEVRNEILEASVAGMWKVYDLAIAEFDLKKALEVVMALAMEANKYVDDQKPWALAKTDTKKLADVMYNLLEMVRHVAVALQPFIPETSQKIMTLYGFFEAASLSPENLKWGVLKPGLALASTGAVLFPRIEEVSKPE